MSVLRICGWAAIAICACQVAIAADDLAIKFRAAKNKLATQLRSPKQEVRDDAIAQLAKFPIPDAADVLLQAGATTRFPDVGRSSYETLRSFANSPEVASHLAKSLKENLRLKRFDLATKVKLDVLLVSTEPKVRALIPELVEQAQLSPDGLLLLATIIDEFAAGNEASQQSLLKMVELPMFASHLGLRRAIVQGLCAINQKPAVDELVMLHSTAEGEIRADIERRLYQLSGLKSAEKPDFATWWMEKKAEFVFPSGPAKAADLPARAGQPSYYGLPVYGSRLIFVIDFSGSMEGPKMAAAQRELIATIAQLPDGVYFNIIAFNSDVFPWKQELLPTGPDTRKEAMRWVGGGAATGLTASYDALRAGLKQNCDAIYFLTDGEPTAGEVTNRQQIVHRISEMNRVRRATIHCIGIGVGAPGNGFDTFLSELSAKNYGAYRRID